MNIFPNTPEIILAIFTNLLTLAVSLFLLKVQIVNSRSVETLEKEQKILIAKQSETNDLIRSKLIVTQEVQEALDFLDNDAFRYLNDVDEKLKILESQKKKISPLTFLGVLLMLSSLGANTYTSSHIYNAGGEVYLSILAVAVFVNILFFVFMWYLGKQLKDYNKDVIAIRQKHDYLSNEIKRAVDLVRSSIDR